MRKPAASRLAGPAVSTATRVPRGTLLRIHSAAIARVSARFKPSSQRTVSGTDAISTSASAAAHSAFSAAGGDNAGTRRHAAISAATDTEASMHSTGSRGSTVLAPSRGYGDTSTTT